MKKSRASKLNKKVSIKRQDAGGAAHGGYEPGYTEVAKVWAEITATSGSVYVGSKQTGEGITHWIKIRRISDLGAVHVIDHGAVRYRVERVRELDDRGRFLMIEAEELARDRTA